MITALLPSHRDCGWTGRSSGGAASLLHALLPPKPPVSSADSCKPSPERSSVLQTSGENRCRSLWGMSVAAFNPLSRTPKLGRWFSLENAVDARPGRANLPPASPRAVLPPVVSVHWCPLRLPECGSRGQDWGDWLGGTSRGSKGRTWWHVKRLGALWHRRDCPGLSGTCAGATRVGLAGRSRARTVPAVPGRLPL